MDLDLDELIDVLSPTPQTVADRLSLMQLTSEARERLRAAAPVALGGLEAGLDAFYARLVRGPSMGSYFMGEAQLARLKGAQKTYLKALLTADYDATHARRCVRIGVVHQRVRLTPQWLMASYPMLVDGVVRSLIEEAASLEDGIEDVTTLVKSMLADASLILDGYAMAIARSEGVEIEIDSRSSAPAAGGPSEPATPRAIGRPTVSRIRVDADEVDERTALLGIDDQTRAVLRGLLPFAERVLPEMMVEFYDHVQGSPDLARMVPPEVNTRLQRQVATYWLELLQGDFDRSYAASRTVVGIVHERVGLSIAEYLIGLALQVTTLLRRVAHHAESPVEATTAVLRAAFFDLSFVVQAYVDARADAALRTAGFASELLAGLASGVAIVDEQLRVQAVNPALLSMFELNPGLVRSVPLAEVLPLPGAADLMRALLAGPASRTTGFVGRGPRVFRATAMRLTSDVLGEGASAALVLDEVTGVSALEADIQRTVKSYEQVIDAVQALVWEVEVPSLTVSLISRSALEVTGYRDITFLARPDGLTRLIPEPDRASFVTRCLATEPGERVALRHRFVRADGKEIWLRSDVTRVEGQNGQGFLRGVSIDVTESRDDEEARLESVGRLAGGVAHEFNNRFTVLLSSLSIIDRSSLSGADREILDEAAAAAQRCARTAQQLLGFAQRQVLRPRRVTLDEVIREAWPRIGRHLSRSVEVELRFQPDLQACHLDRAAFESALEAVVRNAAEAMGRSGRLVVSVEHEPDRDGEEVAGPGWIHVLVTDTGGGMGEEVRRRAFEPFFTTKLDASGLGLSVTRGFVLQSGGRISLFDTEDGCGVDMAFRSAPGGARDGEPSAKPRPSFVLVVDDEPSLRRTLRRLLVRREHDVAAVGTVGEALEILERRPVDVVVTDVVLANGELGTELGARVRERWPEISTVYVSGYTREQLDLTSLADGEWFLSKPFASGQLEAIVAEGIDRTRSLRVARARTGSSFERE